MVSPKIKLLDYFYQFSTMAFNKDNRKTENLMLDFQLNLSLML